MRDLKLNSALNEKTSYRLKVHWLWRLVCLVLVVTTGILYLSHPLRAAESKPTTAKPYKIVFQGNSALSQSSFAKGGGG
jgi:hypothetical protein